MRFIMQSGHVTVQTKHRRPMVVVLGGMASSAWHVWGRATKGHVNTHTWLMGAYRFGSIGRRPDTGMRPPGPNATAQAVAQALASTSASGQAQAIAQAIASAVASGGNATASAVAQAVAQVRDLRWGLLASPPASQWVRLLWHHVRWFL